MQKISLNEFYSQLSFKEEIILAWEVLKKAIKNSLLISLYAASVLLLLYGIGFVLYLVTLNANITIYLFVIYCVLGIICSLFVTYWAFFLQYYNILRVIHGNSSVINFTEMKSVLPNLFMYFIRFLCFSIIISILISPIYFLFEYAITANNIFLFIFSLLVYYFSLVCFTFLHHFFSFFLVFYPQVALWQALGSNMKFIWRNIKYIKNYLLFILATTCLTSIAGYGTLFYFFTKIHIMRFSSLNIISLFVFAVGLLLGLAIIVVSPIYILAYTGVIFKKHNAENNLGQQEVVS